MKQQQARAKKLQDQVELEELMQAELKHKEKELQAGLERERITRELKKVEWVSGITAYFTYHLSPV